MTGLTAEDYGVPVVDVVGVTVRIKDGGPHLRGVVLDDTDQSTVVRKFEHVSTKGAQPEVQLLDLAHALSSELRVQSVRAAALLEAGFASRAGLTVPNKHRLRAEGVALHVLRESTHLVRLGDKRILGTELGLSGPDLRAKGVDLTDEAWADAAGAALVACSL